jgi:hypothetical protein
MAIRALLAGLLAATLSAIPSGSHTSLQAQGKDVVELVVRGCLKGKDLTAVDISGGEGVPGYVNAVFRLSAKGELERAVKQHNGRLVDVTGTVKKTALAEPGFKVGGARVVIGQPMSTDPTANPARNPQKRILPMQVSSIALSAEACPSFVEKK